MAISTYAELQTAVGNYLERDDLSSRTTEFIKLAEDRVAMTLRIRAMETSADLSISSRTTTLPTRYVEMRRVYIDDDPRRRIQFISSIEFWLRNMSSQTGAPQFYTIEGEDFVVGPAPDQTYTGKMLYYQRFATLSGGSDTNWILTNASGLLLYGAMLEAVLYLEDDARILTWAGVWEDLVERVEKMDKRDRHSGDALVARSDVPIL